MSNGAVIGDSLKSFNTRILRTEVKESGKYPFNTTTKIVNLLTLGPFGFIKPIFDRGFKVVFFNLGQNITEVKREISSLNLFDIN